MKLCVCQLKRSSKSRLYTSMKQYVTIINDQFWFNLKTCAYSHVFLFPDMTAFSKAPLVNHQLKNDCELQLL